MNPQIIENNYFLRIRDITLWDKHFGTEIYIVDTDKGKYIVKTLPLFVKHVNDEGFLTDYLYAHGLHVPRFLKSRHGSYAVKTPDRQFTVQEYIEGMVFSVSSAPNWCLEQSAAFLGRANRLLKNYPQLPLMFHKDFFCKDTPIQKMYHYMEKLAEAKKSGDSHLLPLWEEQIAHLDKISRFQIDITKLTYTNSHGDYHIGQAIAKDHDIAVIDWTSACCLPVCLDLITFYVFASPACRNGVVDITGLKNHIHSYTEYFPLTDYDIKTMPYVLYFCHCMCNYTPDELAKIPPSYQPIAEQSYQILRWLYHNVDALSASL